jgi:hypothetical protein
VFFSIGMPFWKDWSVSLAANAAVAGFIRTEFAGDLGVGLAMAPTMMLFAIGIAFGFSLMTKRQS